MSLSFSSATNTATGEQVAIKKLSRPFQTTMHAKRSFRELKLLRHMKHENVSVWQSSICGIHALVNILSSSYNERHWNLRVVGLNEKRLF